MRIPQTLPSKPRLGPSMAGSRLYRRSIVPRADTTQTEPIPSSEAPEASIPEPSMNEPTPIAESFQPEELPPRPSSPLKSLEEPFNKLKESFIKGLGSLTGSFDEELMEEEEEIFYVDPFETFPRNPRVDDLMDIVLQTEWGLSTTEEQRAEITKIVEEIAIPADKCTTRAGLLTSRWRMLWTTEKETLWILRNATAFGSVAGDVLQIIDVDRGTLQNVISFPPEGAFTVNAQITNYEQDVAENTFKQRCDFQFTSASFIVNGRRFKLPPFGKGWFETIYIDEGVRISRDSRGDILICERADDEEPVVGETFGTLYRD